MVKCSELWSSCLSTGKKKEKILNLADEARGKRNAIRLQEAYTVETVVVADSDMVQYHGAEAAQRFLLTVMNMVRCPEVNPQEEGSRERQNQTGIKSVFLAVASFPRNKCYHFCVFMLIVFTSRVISACTVSSRSTTCSTTAVWESGSTFVSPSWCCFTADQ